MAFLIAVLLIASMTASTVLIPGIKAHTPPISIPTYTFMSVSPNPIGAGAAS